MTQQVFHYTATDEKTLEQAVREERIHLNHIVLPRGESFPEHTANATVYMAVVRGRLSIGLDGREPCEYGRGDVLKIPLGTKMRGLNQYDETLELLIFKTFA